MAVMYSELEQEFSEPMREAGLNFKNEYTRALQSFDGFEFERNEKYEAVRAILQIILERYSKTEPTTKQGGFWRKVAGFFSKLFKK